MNSWQEVPIIECHEPMTVPAGRGLVMRSAYYERGYREAFPEIWVRASLSRALVEAAKRLPEDFTLIMLDGWRPVELQGRLFSQYRRIIAEEKGLEGDALEEETLKFVKRPSTDPDRPSPHLTGGSIDVTLGDRSGRPLDLGCDFDELGPRSRTSYYEDKDPLIRDRRRLLCTVMARVGFSNYPEECWHFDMGNQLHHARVGGPARYGPVLIRPREPRITEIAALASGVGTITS